MDLPDELIDLMRRPSTCFVATTMPDGSPQMTQTGSTPTASTCSINTVRASRRSGTSPATRGRPERLRPANPSRYFAVRGRVVDVTTDGAADHIETLAQRYLGGPYPWFGGRDQVRVLLRIAPDKIHAMG